MQTSTLKHITPDRYEGPCKVIGMEYAANYDDYQRKVGFLPIRIIFRVLGSEYPLEHVFWSYWVKDKLGIEYKYIDADNLREFHPLASACTSVKRKGEDWNHITVKLDDLYYLESSSLKLTDSHKKRWHSRYVHISALKEGV
jgi:hypothetical protein